MFEIVQKFVRKRKKGRQFYLCPRKKGQQLSLCPRKKGRLWLNNIDTREMLYARKMLISNLDPIIF